MYYCSHTLKDPALAALAAGGNTAGADSVNHGGKKTGKGDVVGGNVASATGGISGDPKLGAVRVTKLYACSHCSYSADKKVSLNRHMRMHQSSPASAASVCAIASVPAGGVIANAKMSNSAAMPPQNGDGGGAATAALQAAHVNALLAAAAVGAGGGGVGVNQTQLNVQLQSAPSDRYCSECDIAFSSTKTFRAHKMHYCSGRQRDGVMAGIVGAVPAVGAAANAAAVRAATAAANKSRSQSPQESSKSPPHCGAAPQPYLALPTSPIIIIPYAMIRGASILPGPL